MLVRSAQGLYWMSRYLERAQRLCRLLQLQTESLVDRPVREIHFGWSRIYAVSTGSRRLGELSCSAATTTPWPTRTRWPGT